jgi:DNA-binding transcriptional LysR family regulator
MTNIRAVDLNLLVAFDAIFDELSVTRAAERLNVTQPTASGMLRRLRETFDDELFLRTSHGLLPTPRAEDLAAPIKALVHQAEAILRPGGFDPARAEATFRLSASDYMQQVVAVPAIHQLRQLSPKSRVAVMPRSPLQLAEQLIRGEVDVCVCARESVLAETMTVTLFRERYVCVGRKGHRFEEGLLSPERLVECDHLLVDPSGRRFVGPVDAAFAAAGVSRRVAAILPTFFSLFGLLRDEDCLAFVPERLVALRQSELKVFDTQLSIPEFEVVAMWHPRFHCEPRHVWFRKLLLDVATAKT